MIFLNLNFCILVLCCLFVSRDYVFGVGLTGPSPLHG